MSEDEHKKKKEKKIVNFIEVIEGETKSEAAKESMQLILAKLEHAKKMAKKRQEMGF